MVDSLVEESGAVTTSEYARKAAIVMTSMPQQQADQVLSKLNPKQVQAVSNEMVRLGTVTREEQEATIQQFARGRRAITTSDRLPRSTKEVPFSFLQSVSPESLRALLTNEQPQTIAIILSHLPPHYASQVIAGQPVDQQLAVIRRIAELSQVHPHVIAEVEAALQSIFRAA